MAYPTKPSIQTSYTAVEQAQGDGLLPGQELDVDFANLKTAVDALNDFVRGITRSDGRLGNGTVTQDTLAADVLLGLAPPEPWQTGKDYATPDSVFEGNKFYLALTPHTSAVFADDLAAGRWVQLADFTVVQTAAIAAQLAAEAARDEAVIARNEVLAVYLGTFATSPTLTPDGDPLGAGMLYFDSALGTLFVYSGTEWVSASSSIAGVRQVFTYTATAGQTVFSGADSGGSPLVFDSEPLVSVFLNGVRLVVTSDYTVNTATNVVTLVVGAALNDVVQIEVFGNLNASPPQGVNVSQITVNTATFTGRASQAQAEAGTENGLFMTPLRTKEAVTAQVAAGTGGVVARTGAGALVSRTITGTTDQITVTDGNGVSGNPTVAAVVASQAEAQAGANNTKLMTPLRVAEAIPARLNATGSAPIYACRAWVNFDGTTSPGTIRASGNVSSVARSATGTYQINFTTAMPDANYAVAAMCGTIVGRSDSYSQARMKDGTRLTTSVGVETGVPNNSANSNAAEIFVAIFR
jgi:hypothetical protein